MGALQFNGPPAYTFDLANNLIINGGGVLPNSAAPSFTTQSGKFIFFDNSATAGNSVINVSTGGTADFEQLTTAATAVITSAGITEFFNSASAANAIITTNSGGIVKFAGTSTGGSATFITNTGGTFDISGLTSVGMTAGSIAGGGTYALGSKALTVGNGFSTEVSGSITDGGIFNGTGGSLVKAGSGTLILSGANTYSGGTTISAGTLQIGNGGNSGSILGDVTDNANFAFNRNDVVTFAGIVSGSGRLTQAGPGTLILTNANAYGGGTFVTGGILSVDADGELGAAGIGITLAGGELLTTPAGAFSTGRPIDLQGVNTLAAAIATTATYTGTLSDTGSLAIGDSTHAGTIVLTGNNTYSGGTTINSGTLQIGNGLNTSSIVGDVIDNSHLAFNLGQNGTFSGNISGNGTLSQVGPGSLTLTGTNTYNGGTSISGSSLVVGNGGTNGSIVGNVVDNFNLAFNRSDNIVFGGIVSGAGLLSQNGTGTLTLTGANNYTGGTHIFPGTVVAGVDDALGTGPIQLFTGTLRIPGGVTLHNEVIFGAGGFLDNLGTLIGNVTDGGSAPERVINSGTINGNVALASPEDIVQLFTGSKITGDLTLAANDNNSILILDGAGQQLLSQAVLGTITDNGSLVKQGTGTWTIDRALSAPLGTDILAGTLIVEAALTTSQVNIAPEGTLQLNSGGSVGNLVDNGSLIFAGTGTVTFSSVISGAGNVVQNGTGTTILSGRNTYSGGTIIELGTLLVNSPQALGTGDVLVNGGILGADPQPINVLGNYTQNAGGTLQLNIAGRAAGQFDVLNVTGNAGLNGTLRLLNLGYQPQNGDKLKLVTTGGAVTGRFATVQNPFTLASGFNTIALVYARQSVTLEFLRLNPPTPPVPPPIVITTDFASFALTPNQLAAANLLDAIQLDPRASNLISFLNKEPFANYPSDFEKMSPQGLTAFYEITFSNANIQRLNLEDRLDDIHHGSNGFSSNMKVNGGTVNLDPAGPDGKSSKTVVEPVLQHDRENRWGVWMTGFGDFVSVDADTNAQGYNFTTGGVTLGIDFRITDQLAIGVMGDYSHTWTSVNPAGHMDVNSGRGGVYATWYNHGLYFNGAIYGGHNNYDSSRSGLLGLATGGTEGAEWSTFVSGGYDFHFGALTVGPVAALQYTSVGIDGFSEQGSAAPLDDPFRFRPVAPQRYRLPSLLPMADR